MTTNILDAYGEDGDFAYMNGNVGGGITIETSPTGNFRTGFARCAINIAGDNGNIYSQAFAVRLWPIGGLTTAWVSSRLAGTNGNSVVKLWGLFDPNNVLRIYMISQEHNSMGGPYEIYKVDALGNATMLGITSSGFSTAPSVPDKFDCNFNYSTTGFITLYINSSLVFSYSGDITTDGQTQLGGTYHGCLAVGNGNNTSWSECIVADGDTRDLSVVTCSASGTGTTDQWTGAYTNVNQIAVNDANFDTTTTSGDVQLYTMTGITTGNFDILTLVTNIRATQGAGALTHIALAQEISGTQYVTSPKNFPTAFGPVQFIQELNPATGQLWTQSDVNAGGFQSGYKATT